MLIKTQLTKREQNHTTVSYTQVYCASGLATLRKTVTHVSCPAAVSYLQEKQELYKDI